MTEVTSTGIDGAVVRVQTVKDAPRQYQAAYELPADIDGEATSAKLENGVLTLAFKVAADEGLLLLDMKDLRATLQ